MTTGYSAADFEGHRIAHNGDEIALRRDNSDLAWSKFAWNRDRGAYDSYAWSATCALAYNGWTPGPPPRNGNEQANEQARIDHIQEQDRIIRRRNEEIESLRKELDKAQDENAEQRKTILGLDLDVRIRDKRIEEQDAKIETLRDDVWERSEIIGDLREDLASAESRGPSTPKEALTLAWELACPVSEGQMIPVGTPFIEKFGDGEMVYRPDGEGWKRTARVDGAFEIRTLAPLPASRPKHAEIVEKVLTTDTCLSPRPELADKIARAIEQQEADDE